ERLVRGDVLARNDVAERRVGGDLELGVDRAIDAVEPRPQRDPVRRDVTRDDPVGELAALRARRPADRGQALGERLRGEHGGTGPGTGRGHELAASLHGATLAGRALTERQFSANLERDVAVLALRPRLALGEQRLER